MPEPPRGQAERANPAGTGTPRTWRDYRVLWQTPSYVLDTLGMLAMTFVLGGVGAFMPTYVYEREARFSLTSAALERFEEKANPPAELLARLRPLVDEAERTKDE